MKNGKIGEFLRAMRAWLVFNRGALEVRRLGGCMFSVVVMFGYSRVLLTPKREVYVPPGVNIDRVQSEDTVRYEGSLDR